MPKFKSAKLNDLICARPNIDAREVDELWLSIDGSFIDESID